MGLVDVLEDRLEMSESALVMHVRRRNRRDRHREQPRACRETGEKDGEGSFFSFLIGKFLNLTNNIFDIEVYTRVKVLCTSRKVK